MKHEKSKNDAMRHELDHIDAKILNLLRENARMPLKEIAEHVFLSSPAVSARIERLEKEGYITGYQVKLNPALLGYPIKAFINLEVEPVQKKEFYHYKAERFLHNKNLYPLQDKILKAFQQRSADIFLQTVLLHCPADHMLYRQQHVLRHY